MESPVTNHDCEVRVVVTRAPDCRSWADAMNSAAPSRSRAWKWWVCGLLLLATTINYMDRQTLANAAVRITKEFQLSKEQYGVLELAFGWAFAAGSLLFGFTADRVSTRWLYPAVLFAWSLM